MTAASDLGQEFAALATALISDDFGGEGATIKQPVGSTGPEEDPTPVAVTPTAFSTFEDRNIQSLKDHLVEGTTRFLYVSGGVSFTPEVGDMVKLDRETPYSKVLKVMRYGVGGEDSLYILMTDG